MASTHLRIHAEEPSLADVVPSGGTDRRSSAPIFRALVTFPRSFEGRQWLAVGEDGIESKRSLTPEEAHELLSRYLAAGPAGGGLHGAGPPETFQVVSVVFLTAKSGAREEVLPATVRRIQDALATKEPPRGRVLEMGCLRIDKDAYLAKVFGRSIPLTALEFRLLWTLAERKDRVQSRETLLNEVWELSDRVYTRTVDTHITRLRRKLGGAGKAIETVRSVGYRFSASAAYAAREDDADAAASGPRSDHWGT